MFQLLRAAPVGPAFVCGPASLLLCIQITVLLSVRYLGGHFFNRTFLFRLSVDTDTRLSVVGCTSDRGIFPQAADCSIELPH